MSRVHMIISGDVQGVGFRAWALRFVRGKPIMGWVKNREDGAVEIMAEGSRAILEDFVKACQHGPEVAWVEHVDTEWAQATREFSNFQVIY